LNCRAVLQKQSPRMCHSSGSDQMLGIGFAISHSNEEQSHWSVWQFYELKNFWCDCS